MVSSVTLVTITLALASSAFSQHVTGPQYRPPVPIISMEEVRDGHNQFSLSYQTGDGQVRTAHGALKVLPNGEHVLVQRGTVGYTAPDGTPVSIAYVADENGYRAEGDVIPKGPADIPIH